MNSETPVDPAALREEVKSKYREVALNPHGEFHFHTGRPLPRGLATIRPRLMLCRMQPLNHSRALRTRFRFDHCNRASGLSMSAPAAGLTVSLPPVRSAPKAAWSASI